MREASHRLSVVVAAYNVERELRVLLESLGRSRFRDYEVCLCDDASTDGTPAVVREFMGRLDLRLVRNSENRGVTQARNRALGLARAPMLLFLDSDVRVYPETISRLLELMEETGADVVDGVYSDVALDDDPFSRYYALFAHQSLPVSKRPFAYNVFNGFCALCRREVMERLGGHQVVAKGVEVENEVLGRRIVAGGFKLLMAPEVIVDHHWGGWSKLWFIFTRRVYWWVKVYFADGCRFESVLTTAGYGVATLCLPLASVNALGAAWHPALGWIASVLGLGFVCGYAYFYDFAFRRRGAAYLMWCMGLSALLAFPAGLSAAYSAIEEMALKLARGRGTLDPEALRF